VLRRVPNTIGRFLVLWAAGAAFLLWDPFEIDDATSRYSVDVFHQIVAYRYPLGRSAHSEPPHERISVVLIEDRTFEESLDETWPMRYVQHARILGRILSYEPAAVFVDILFLDDDRDDPTIDSLLAVIDDYRAAHVPLVFADASAGLGRDGEVVAAIAEHDSTVFGQVAWKDSGKTPSYYPIAVAPADDEPLTRTRAPQTYLTPAFQIYEQLCAPTSASNDRGAFRRRCDLLWSTYRQAHEDCPNDGTCAPYPAECVFCGARWPGEEPPRNAMHVDWGSRPLREDGPHRYRDCPPDALSRDSLLVRAVQRAFLGATPFQSSCYFHDTLLAEHVLFPGSAGPDRVRRLLRSRVVFYGAHIAGVPDLVDSPTRASLPGVHLHAMAFDNLATYGPAYKGSFRPEMWIFETADIVEAIAIFVFALCALTMRRRAGRWLAKRTGTTQFAAAERDRLYRIAAFVCEALGFVLAAFTVCATGFFAYIALGLAPLDWVGVLVAGGVGLGVAHLYERGILPTLGALVDDCARLLWLCGLNLRAFANDASTETRPVDADTIAANQTPRSSSAPGDTASDTPRSPSTRGNANAATDHTEPPVRAA
jgi:hypothetical protein